MAPNQPATFLREALAAGQAAAQAGGPAAFDAAVRRGLEACAEIGASGRPPPPRELEELLSLQARLLQQATALRDQLGQALERASRSRRATSAYTGR